MSRWVGANFDLGALRSFRELLSQPVYFNESLLQFELLGQIWHRPMNFLGRGGSWVVTHAFYFCILLFRICCGPAARGAARGGTGADATRTRGGPASSRYHANGAEDLTIPDHVAVILHCRHRRSRCGTRSALCIAQRSRFSHRHDAQYPA